MTFDSNSISVIGGLLSAHLLSYRLYSNDDEPVLNLLERSELHPYWPCDGPLLRMAIDVADKVMPAFNTSTGMPYGTVNLRYGVPKGETSETWFVSFKLFFLTINQSFFLLV